METKSTPQSPDLEKWNHTVRVSVVIYREHTGSSRDVMVIVVGNGHGDTCSNPRKVDCISHRINILGKGMDPIILPPAIDK